MNTFTPAEEHLHNQRTLKAIATFYRFHSEAGNVERAAYHFARYTAFLREFTLGLDTENV